MFLHFYVILFTGEGGLPNLPPDVDPPDAETPPPKDTWDTTGYGQQAGGAHPTGMHTCFQGFLAAKITITKLQLHFLYGKYLTVHGR